MQLAALVIFDSEDPLLDLDGDADATGSEEAMRSAIVAALPNLQSVVCVLEAGEGRRMFAAHLVAAQMMDQAVDALAAKRPPAARAKRRLH